MGNVLATVSDRKVEVSTDSVTIDHFEADIVSAQEYYSFGMLMPGRGFSGNKYRYGFNGKENDNEVKGDGNQQDYGFRIYDPRIGRFLSVDPLTAKYPWYTPYQFAGNTPIQAADLDGLEEWMKQTEFALKRKAEMKIAHAEQIKIKSESWKYRENDIMMRIDGVTQMGPRSVVLQNAAIAEDRYNDALASSLQGPFGSIGYMINGDKGAFIGSGVDGVMVSFAGIPTENSGVFPRRTGVQPVRSVAYTEARAVRFFGKMDPLVRTTAEAIEAAMPNSVLSVERQIMNPQTGKPLTDFDIELNNYIIEVNDGGGTGKLRQIQNNIQPNTKKEVILFSPKMGGAVEKSMKANNIKAFRNIKDLIEYVTPKK